MGFIRVSVKDVNEIKPVKDWLESKTLLNKSKKIIRNGEISYIFTMIPSQDKFHIDQLLSRFKSTIDEYQIDDPLHMHEQGTLNVTIKDTIRVFYSDNGFGYNEKLDDFIPKRWSIYHPMVLFNSNTFDSALWASELSKLDQSAFFQFILDRHFPKLTHVAVNKPINKLDVMRVPTNIIPLHGDFGPQIQENILHNPTQIDFNNAFWCSTVQNGIFQSWAPKYTMFSRGNIKEKKRILDNFKNLEQSFVLDLYAGIGYFALSYLSRHAKLLCWEMNPWSVEALRRNCEANNFTSKVNDLNYEDSTEVYIFRDNNETSIETVNKLMKNPVSLPISHINLGLLPSSKQSWPLAKHFLSMSTLNTIIHIHENVHVDDLTQFSDEIIQYFPNCKLLEIVKVKTFAPDIWHTVFDIQLQQHL